MEQQLHLSGGAWNSDPWYAKISYRLPSEQSLSSSGFRVCQEEKLVDHGRWNFFLEQCWRLALASASVRLGDAEPQPTEGYCGFGFRVVREEELDV